MLTELLAERCDKPYEVLANNMERDYYMDAEESLRYGIVDEIITGLGKPGKKLSDIEKCELENKEIANKED